MFEKTVFAVAKISARLRAEIIFVVFMVCFF